MTIITWPDYKTKTKMKKKKSSSKRIKKKKKKTEKKKKINKKLMFFSKKGCPHCVKFEKIWDKLNKKFKNIHFMKVDGHNCPKLKKKYNITQYPTLVLIKNGKSVQFENKRTYPNIVNFINKM